MYVILNYTDAATVPKLCIDMQKQFRKYLIRAIYYVHVNSKCILVHFISSCSTTCKIIKDFAVDYHTFKTEHCRILFSVIDLPLASTRVESYISGRFFSLRTLVDLYNACR